MKLRLVAKTDVGQVRDHNEDNFIINPDLGIHNWEFDVHQQYQLSGAGTILAVADGMGGLNAGEVASEKAINAVKSYFASLLGVTDVNQIPGAMREVFFTANQMIDAHAQLYPATSGMGTTLTVAWLRDQVVHVSWVGDSRAYLFRPNPQDDLPALRRLSNDHSLVQEWVDQGKLSDEQAFYHPQNHIVTQSLGDGGGSKINPGYANAVLQVGDMVMLCSDGLNGMLQDQQIQAIFQAFPNEPNQVAELLIQQANQAGGNDNITVEIAQILEVAGQALVPRKRNSNKKSISRTTLSIFFALIGVVLVANIWLSIDKKQRSPASEDSAPSKGSRIVNANPASIPPPTTQFPKQKEQGRSTPPSKTPHNPNENSKFTLPNKKDTTLDHSIDSLSFYLRKHKPKINKTSNNNEGEESRDNNRRERGVGEISGPPDSKPTPSINSTPSNSSPLPEKKCKFTKDENRLYRTSLPYSTVGSTRPQYIGEYDCISIVGTIAYVKRNSNYYVITCENSSPQNIKFLPEGVIFNCK